MNISTRCFALLFLLLLSHQILPVISDTQQQQQQTTHEDKPSRFQFVSNTLSLLKKAHQNSVEKIKTIVHDLRLQLTSPKPDEDAVKKNAETNKGKVEETAKPAAAATEQKTAKPEAETVQKTAEKGYGQMQQASKHTSSSDMPQTVAQVSGIGRNFPDLFQHSLGSALLFTWQPSTNKALTPHVVRFNQIV
ncbi:hypothetical protein V6N13_133209 [Hibiscus sabdariffa]|uniref:Uncharacterized protein n=1 Tax=Hibiscus sabdariffa TaxID=183260 RepID=A0ABR2CI65_9ROSI